MPLDILKRDTAKNPDGEPLVINRGHMIKISKRIVILNFGDLRLTNTFHVIPSNADYDTSPEMSKSAFFAWKCQKR
jgi:hypothetical protein